MNTRLTRADFDTFPTLPGIVTATERAELYRMSDAINAELRNEREAHAHLCSRCESALTHCTTPQACEAAERVRPVPRWMQRVLADQEPSGSREIPNWLLYTLLAIAAAVVLFVAPGVA
jgi:hypothetical protein